MNVDDIIEDESEPLDDAPELDGELEGEPLGESESEFGSGDVDPATKPPWKRYAVSVFLAALLGAAGGGAGVYAGLKTAKPNPIVQAPLNLEPLEATVKRLSARLQAAEAKLKTAANRPALVTEPVDLSPLETRLKTLESAPRPEIDPVALTALQAAQKDGFEWPDVSQLETRIAALEKDVDRPTEAAIPADLLERLSSLEENIETAQNASAAVGQSSKLITSLETRLSALEKRPAPEPFVERVSILAFPKDKLIEALDESREGGFIEKTLARHIQVKKENDPMTLIDAIEADISDGRLAPALEKFERLPTAVRAAGQAWYESVKASL